MRTLCRAPQGLNRRIPHGFCTLPHTTVAGARFAHEPDRPPFAEQKGFRINRLAELDQAAIPAGSRRSYSLLTTA